MCGEREARREATRRAFDQLQYELMHNLVIETTRMGIEVKNLKMRVESLASRLEFNERRARALESVVVYKPSRRRSPGGAGIPGTLRSARGPGPSSVRAAAEARCSVKRRSRFAAAFRKPDGEQLRPGTAGRRSRTTKPSPPSSARAARRTAGRGDHGTAWRSADRRVFR